jgi:hypothetical protein
VQVCKEARGRKGSGGYSSNGGLGPFLIAFCSLSGPFIEAQRKKIDSGPWNVGRRSGAQNGRFAIKNDARAVGLLRDPVDFDPKRSASQIHFKIFVHRKILSLNKMA